MSRSRLAVGLTLAVLAVSYAAVSSSLADASAPSATGLLGAVAGAIGGDGHEVVLVDQGLGGLPIGTQPLPDGWTLEQDLATNPQNGEPARHHLVMRGPRGEAIVALGSQVYGGYMSGGDREGAWQQLAAAGLAGDVSGLQLGPLAPSADVEALASFQDLARRLAAQGLRIEGLEAPFRGQRGGEPVEGVVQVVHGQFAPQAGMVQATALVAPAGSLAALRAEARRLADAFRPNPEHRQQVAAIGAQYRGQVAAQHDQTMSQHAAFTAQMQAGHAQRMGQIESSAAAHQQRMRGMWASHDAQMAGWQAQQATSDEMHRRTINGINGTADIYDPQTGTTYSGVDNSAGSYWVDPTQGTVVGADRYSDNPDAYRYTQGVNLDDL